MNIFDKVTVALTEHGKKTMDDYIKKLEKETGMEFKSPYINDNDDIIIPLCSLMHIFGKDMYDVFIDGETPFKDNEINCGENYKYKNLEKEKDMQKTPDMMHNHGTECGIKIAAVVKELYPEAIAIIPLYRSCFVVTQDDAQKEKGNCTMHLYTDPHWFGEEINIDTLKKEECHKTVNVHGNTGDNAWAWNWVW